MTQPTVVFFGPDSNSGVKRKAKHKVYLRTLLFSSSHRGQVVESLHVNLSRGESKQNFSIWVYAGESGKLVRGSGLFVGRDGIACDHHFLLPEDGSEFPFLTGDYTLRVFAKRTTDSAARELLAIRIGISEQHAEKLKNRDAGIYFDWGPDQSRYHAHVDEHPVQPDPAQLLKALLPVVGRPDDADGAWVG